MTFETIALLKGTAGTASDNLANVLGYRNSGDGGGGDFYWDSLSTEKDNGGTTFEVTGTTAGRWKRLYSGAVYFKWFGAVADGQADDSLPMQTLMNTFSGGEYLYGKNLIIESDPNANYGLGNPIYIPYNISIDFNNATITPLSGNGLTDKYLFYLNVKESGASNKPFSEGFPSYIRNMYIDNSVHNVDDLDVFFSFSKHLIENIRTNTVRTFYSRTGNSNDQYNDSIHLNRIAAYNSQSGSSYINIGWLGDNLKIEDIDLQGAQLNIKYCQGGILDRILNANITIDSCFGLTISNTHMEKGNIYVKNSMVKLSNVLHFYQHSVPLTITNDLSSSASLANKTCIIENYTVLYNHDGGSLLENAYGITDVYDAFFNGNVIINNFFRANNYHDPQYMTCSATRITRDGSTPLDDYNCNPANSISSTLVNGKITSTIQSINSGVQTSLYISASGEHFLEAPADYYYKAVILLGDSRCLVATTAVITLQPAFYTVSALLNAPSIANPVLRSGASFTLRLYRGTKPDIYTHIVDIPFTSFDNIVDYGFYVSTGQYWQKRKDEDVGPLDNFNNATSASYFIQNADGTKLVKLNAAPLYGNWKIGDKVEKIIPDASGIGWICTDDSPLTFIPL